MLRHFVRLKDRLQPETLWFPMPALFAVGLGIVLYGGLLIQLNPRLGSHADTLAFPSDPQPDGAIWLAVSTHDEDVVVTTSDRKIFHWPASEPSEESVDGLVEYLQKRIAYEQMSAGLAGESRFLTSTAVIAADQRLRYRHLKPILSALALAGITHYGFETRGTLAINEQMSSPAEDEHKE